MTKSSNRIMWVDFAKGIAILFVVFGHTLSKNGTDIEGLARGLIFSFHMPLFFALSGVTMKISEDNDQFLRRIKKSFSSLIVPALMIYLLRLVFELFQGKTLHINWKAFLSRKILILSFSSGVKVNVLGSEVPAFGMMWFLIALFLARIVLDAICMKYATHKKRWIIIVLSCILSYFISDIQMLPFVLDLAGVIILFIYFGYYAEKEFRKTLSWKTTLFSFFLWLFSFLFIYVKTGSYLEIAQRSYPSFPLCIICALSAVTFIFGLFSRIQDNKMLCCKYIGEHSLLFFGVHAMDYTYRILWELTGSNFVNALIRICIDTALFFIISAFIRFRQNRNMTAD